jgi:hypothetical protein
MLPKALGGTRRKNMYSCTGFVNAFPSAQLPKAWSKFADAGFFRMRSDGSEVALFPAYPFLLQRVAELCEVVNEPVAAFMLSAVNSNKNADATKGYLAEYMLCLELSIASSRLYDLLCVTEMHKPLSEHTECRLFRTNKDIERKRGTLWLVQDGSSVKGAATRRSDISVALTAQLEPVWAHLEVKHVKYSSKAKAAMHVKNFFAIACNDLKSGAMPSNTVYAFVSMLSCKCAATDVDGWLDACVPSDCAISRMPGKGRKTQPSGHGLHLMYSLKKSERVFYFVVLETFAGEDNTFFDFSCLRELSLAHRRFSLDGLIERILLPSTKSLVYVSVKLELCPAAIVVTCGDSLTRQQKRVAQRTRATWCSVARAH